jgi:hypothetical protein
MQISEFLCSELRKLRIPELNFRPWRSWRLGESHFSSRHELSG